MNPLACVAECSWSVGGVSVFWSVGGVSVECRSSGGGVSVVCRWSVGGVSGGCPWGFSGMSVGCGAALSYPLVTQGASVHTPPGPQVHKTPCDGPGVHLGIQGTPGDAPWPPEAPMGYGAPNYLEPFFKTGKRSNISSNKPDELMCEVAARV